MVEALGRSNGHVRKDPVRHSIRVEVGWKRCQLRRDFGLAHPSAAQAMLLEVAARTAWLLDRVDDKLLELSAEGLERSTQQLLHERTLMADRLTRTLTLLGRERGPLARRRIVSPP